MISIQIARLRWLLPLSLTLIAGCTDSDPTTDNRSPGHAPVPVTAVSNSPADLWWQRIYELCGKAFEGRLVSTDEVDADFSAQSMIMHVRRCDPARIEIPFHVAENRSRTWVLTRQGGAIQLQHDHRHEDGTEDQVTLYGGVSTDGGTAETQSFPADDTSRQLFEQNELSASVSNTWSMEEIVPGERFSYILRRPGRHFQVDFDLRQASEAPPTPWGHD